MLDQDYKRLSALFEKDLTVYLDSVKDDVPPALFEAIEYSLKNGGKRVRPVLIYAVSEMLGISLEEVKFYALAIEFIHAYSLIHDDLPSMDNDDFRRGKPSTHKQFGEAMAILAGDALLNLAIETALKKPNFTEEDVSCLKLLFYCSGMKGMVKGQVLDIINEKNTTNGESLLFDIMANKTGKLLVAPILIPSILADKSYFNELSELATLIGVLFQVKDDILDATGDFNLLGKTPHKDDKSDKLTAVKVYGLEGAKNYAKTIYDKCDVLLEKIPNSMFLQNFIDFIYNRNY